MTCPDCIANASRVLALEQELVAYMAIVEGNEDERTVRLLSVGLDLMPSVARLVYRLWLTNGRPVLAGALADSLWPESKAADPCVSVRRLIVHARSALGQEFIETAPMNGGYRLTETGLARVARLLPPSLLPK